LINYLI